jgi:hypothetical protein
MMLIYIFLVIFTTTLVIEADKFQNEEKFYLLHRLSEINPKIVWDSTEFLSDLSEEFARCENVERLGVASVSKKTPDGEHVIALLGKTRGTLTDFVALVPYVKHVIHHWILSGEYNDEFRAAEKIGCSSKHGCDGYSLVSCLLTPGSVPLNNAIKGTGSQRAFTPEQYQLAESITNKTWDESNFLENLAGSEAHCAMVVNDNWHFAITKSVATERGMRLIGRYGHVLNRGNTNQAITTIIRQFDSIPSEFDSIGCSLIPDCKDDDISDLIYVLVLCIFN